MPGLALAGYRMYIHMRPQPDELVLPLRHPNLITILDLAEIGDRHCLAMEYAPNVLDFREVVSPAEIADDGIVGKPGSG